MKNFMVLTGLLAAFATPVLAQDMPSLGTTLTANHNAIATDNGIAVDIGRLTVDMSTTTIDRSTTTVDRSKTISTTTTTSQVDKSRTGTVSDIAKSAVVMHSAGGVAQTATNSGDVTVRGTMDGANLQTTATGTSGGLNALMSISATGAANTVSTTTIRSR